MLKLSVTDVPPERLAGVKAKIYTNKDEFLDLAAPIYGADVEEGTTLTIKDGSEYKIVAYCTKDLFFCAAKLAGNFRGRVVFDLRNVSDIYGIITGSALTAWKFDKYKSKKNVVEIVFSVEKDRVEEAKKAVEHARAQAFARELASEPPNVLNPQTFPERIKEMATGLPIEVEVLEKDDLEKEGLNLLLAVGKGSDIPPRLLIIRYNGGGKKVALVGKGVTFDSGGYNLKPPEYMKEMHADMSGAAAVSAAALWAAKLSLNVNLTAYVPLAENLISGRAYKMEDIIKSYSGKYVHIGNTDAEGRLILADALAYAKKDGPDVTFTLATLTGAQVIALGHEIAALYATHDEDAKLVEEASKETYEFVWRMPLYERYSKLLEHPSADINNIASKRVAGSITGALFLKAFAPERWVYLDIAGPAMADMFRADWCSPYPTGWGTRLLLKTLEKMR